MPKKKPPVKQPLRNNLPRDPDRLMNPELSYAFAEDTARTIDSQIIPAIQAENGNLSAAARRLEICPDTLRRWAHKEPKIQKALDKARIETIREHK